MKIGIDCHNLEGQRTGVGRYLWNILEERKKLLGSDPVNNGVRPQKIELFLYFKNEVPDVALNLTGSDPVNIGVGPRCNLRVLNSKSNALFKHWHLPRAAVRDKIDVLFCPDYVLPLPFTFFSFYTKNLLSQDFCIKTAVTIHDIIYEARPQEYSWPSWKDKILLKWASKQSAKKADIVFAPSEFTKNEILKYYRVRPEKVWVTPLAADPQFVKIDLPGEVIAEELSMGVLGDWEKLRRKYHIEDRFVLFVGSIFNRRFLPQKILAFSEFGKNYPDYQFLIIGKNHTKPFLDVERLVADANKKLGREAIIWKKHASDEELVYLYNGAFATLWLSSYEGFGLPVLESMACGTPVITSPNGSLPEIVGDAAMYVAHPENPEEISSALTHLARYDSYRNELILKGLARAAQFSWQKTAEDTLTNLEKLIK